MKSIVIYDTVYGNTEKIADAIKENIPGATMARANETETLELSLFDLVVAILLIIVLALMLSVGVTTNAHAFINDFAGDPDKRLVG